MHLLVAVAAAADDDDNNNSHNNNAIISSPGIARRKADVLSMLLSLFLTVSLETNYYLRMYGTNFHHIFNSGTHIGGHDQSGLFSQSFKGR